MAAELLVSGCHGRQEGARTVQGRALLWQAFGAQELARHQIGTCCMQQGSAGQHMTDTRSQTARPQAQPSEQVRGAAVAGHAPFCSFSGVLTSSRVLPCPRGVVCTPSGAAALMRLLAAGTTLLTAFLELKGYSTAQKRLAEAPTAWSLDGASTAVLAQLLASDTWQDKPW